MKAIIPTDSEAPMHTRHIRFLLVGLLMLGVGLSTRAQSRPPTATNKVFLYSKPAVVRIYCGYAGQWSWEGRLWRTQSVASGSGFFFHPDGYLLTNAHVVSSIREGDQAGKRTLLLQLAIQVLQGRGLAVNRDSLIKAAQYLDQHASLVEFKRIGLVALQSGTRAPFEIKAFGAPSGEGRDLITGKDVAVLKVEVKNAPTLALGNSEEAQVGDHTFVMGYPGAADSTLLDAKSTLEPTINDGAISSKKTSADGAPIFQTNTSATHGNSGGPVINEKGEAIGLLTFRGNLVNGQEVQGFSFIVPMSTAMEFVHQAGTSARLSPVDAKWRHGLDYFWNGEYRNARDDFHEVLALFADHGEAAKLLTECQEHIAKGDDKSFQGTLMRLGMFGFGFLVLVGGGALLLVVLLRRKKPAPTPAPKAAPPVPSGTVPQPSPALIPRTELFKAGVAGGQLACLAGPVQGQSFPVGQGVYIGRDPVRSQIVVGDSQVSGQHLWVGPLNGRIIARDPGSTNGTYLNGQMGQRIGDAELKDGDTLTLGLMGSVRFQYKA
jgi:S1-C subfamily serine protease